MTCVAPPFARAVLAEATRIAPRRRTSSDGTCASPAHHAQNPTSDHEPSGPHNYCHAVDISIDPGVFDPRDYLAAIIARHDPRLEYFVTNFSGWRGQPWNLPDVIYDLRVSPSWRQNGPYSQAHAGASAHVHLSFPPSAEQSTAPFFGAPIEEDDLPLTDTDLKKITATLAPLIREECSAAVRNALGGYVDGKWVDGALAAELRKEHGLAGK